MVGLDRNDGIGMAKGKSYVGLKRFLEGERRVGWTYLLGLDGRDGRNGGEGMGARCS